MLRNLALTAVALNLAACASSTSLGESGPRLVFYPTEMFKRAGPIQARTEGAACIEKARQAGITPEGVSEELPPAATGAVVGGVAGMVGSLVSGRGMEASIKAAAVGSVAGAAAGTTQSAFIKDQPADVFRAFVRRCMADKGYEVIGWR